MTTATGTAGLVGADVDRVDGPSKVTGAARYPADFGLENLAHAVLVQSTVAAGRIRRMATAAAEAAPGVLTVITHRNAPRLARAPGGLGIGPPAPLQDDRVVHHGQHIAVVVAQTLEQAAAAARLVEADYETAEPLLDLDDPRAGRVDNAAGRDVSRGDVAAGLAAAEVIVAATYTTPVQTNNPLGLFATWCFLVGTRLAQVEEGGGAQRDDSPHAQDPAGVQDVGGADDVDGVEVGDVLTGSAEQRGGVDGRLASLGGCEHVVGVGNVPPDQLDTVGEECRRLVRIADKCPDIVTALDELLADVGAGQTSCACHEDGTHGRSPVRKSENGTVMPRAGPPRG